MRAAVDVPVDALVEVDQAALVARRPRELGEQRPASARSAAVRRSAASARGGRLERAPHLGQAGQVADVDRRDEHAAAREDLHQPLVRERAQRLADRRPAEARAAPSGRAR